MGRTMGRSRRYARGARSVWGFSGGPGFFRGVLVVVVSMVVLVMVLVRALVSPPVSVPGGLAAGVSLIWVSSVLAVFELARIGSSVSCGGAIFQVQRTVARTVRVTLSRRVAWHQVMMN